MQASTERPLAEPAKSEAPPAWDPADWVPSAEGVFVIIRPDGSRVRVTAIDRCGPSLQRTAPLTPPSLQRTKPLTPREAAEYRRKARSTWISQHRAAGLEAANTEAGNAEDLELEHRDCRLFDRRLREGFHMLANDESVSLLYYEFGYD